MGLAPSCGLSLCWSAAVDVGPALFLFATLLEYLVVCTASCVQITMYSLGSLGQHPSLLDPVFDLTEAVAEAHVMLGLAVWLCASGVTLLSLSVREVLCPDVSSSEGWGRGEMTGEGHTITVRSLRLVKEGVGMVWRDWGTWHHW